MAETIISRWFLPSFPHARPVEYRETLNRLSHASLEGYIATCAALRDADLRSSIQAILAPALVLCGAGDVVVTPEQTCEWAACLPEAQVEMIAGAAHLPCIEQCDLFAARLKAFFEEIGDAR